ncbi:MAG: Spy/CpxP family protein refolding chaperone, partial [Cyanobacteria bacterium P01_F01_bin.4]
AQTVEIKTDALPSKRVTASIQKMILETEMDDRTQARSPVDKPNLVSLFALLTPATQGVNLPPWLSELNLTPEQTHQVMMIDAMLAQELEAILTSDQLAQLQDSFADDSSETLGIDALGLGLSVYQQTAVDVAIQDAMQRLLNILSVEQRQQFFQDLWDDRSTPDTNLDI